MGFELHHASQDTIENADKVVNGVEKAIWPVLEENLGVKVLSDSVMLKWAVRHAAWSWTRFQVKLSYLSMRRITPTDYHAASAAVPATPSRVTTKSSRVIG